MKSGGAIAFYLTLICAQFAAIIGFMVHSGRQERQIELWRIEAADWEHIADSYKVAAATYAVSSEKCLQAVRDYQRMVFKPVEMSK